MLRTFNCGIGMVLCLPAEHQAQASELLQAAGETVYPIGDIVAHSSQRIVFI
jgi:phosphoribosylformylglycinamidine cyclo-ligase